jgi:hypothetical protein
MSTHCIIVNLGPSWEMDLHGTEKEARTLKPGRRPKYVHDDLESAEAEALRLHQKHAGPAGRFVIFQAVAATEWRTPFEIAAQTIAVIEPYDGPLPLAMPARAPRKTKNKKAKP